MFSISKPVVNFQERVLLVLIREKANNLSVLLTVSGLLSVFADFFFAEDSAVSVRKFFISRHTLVARYYIFILAVLCPSIRSTFISPHFVSVC